MFPLGKGSDSFAESIKISWNIHWYNQNKSITRENIVAQKVLQIFYKYFILKNRSKCIGWLSIPAREANDSLHTACCRAAAAACPY